MSARDGGRVRKERRKRGKVGCNETVESNETREKVLVTSGVSLSGSLCEKFRERDRCSCPML